MLYNSVRVTKVNSRLRIYTISAKDFIGSKIGVDLDVETAIQ